MPWKKGQSGNPGGRTKQYIEIRDAAQKASPTAFRTLTEIAKHGKTEASRVQAANSILDRAFGRPAHTYTGEGGTGPITAELKVTFVDGEGQSEPAEPVQAEDNGGSSVPGQAPDPV